VLADPHHFPRWWPRVERVEGVDRRRWTSVMTSRRGRTVRIDYRVLDERAPRLRRWEQELAGSPFERILAEAVTEARLEPVPEGVRVTLAARQQLRGTSRFGSLLARRALRAQLDEALDGLEAVCAS